MIKEVSSLLRLFIDEEVKKAKEFDMPHMPTLGSAYEEIIKAGIAQNYILPEGIDLRVVSGFISIDGEMQPQQIDCMLVHGEGVRYGLTQEYIYEIDNVLGLFEIKKNLRKSDLYDAFEHLGIIKRKYAEFFDKKIESGYEPNLFLAQKHFSQITGKVAPEKYSDIYLLDISDAMLFYTLVQESLSPFIVMHGFEGYKTEEGLRTAFIDILEQQYNENKQLGVTKLPTLITSNNYTLVKSNGMPFMSLLDEGKWCVLTSSRHNVASLLIEVLWSKISFFMQTAMPWNDDLYMENLIPLLSAEYVKRKDGMGWLYQSVEVGEKKLLREDDVTWKPEKIGVSESFLVQRMIESSGVLSVDAQLIIEFTMEYGEVIHDAVDNLTKTSIFMFNNTHVLPISDITYCLFVEDGGCWVSTEKERFVIWCQKEKLSTKLQVINKVL